MVINQKFQKINNICYDPVKKLHFDLYFPHLKFPIKHKTPLIFLHGGGFHSGSEENRFSLLFIENMLQRGFPVFSIQYSTSRKKIPLEHKAKIATLDIYKAVDYISDQFNYQSVSHPQYLIAGLSAGAIIAMLMGLNFFTSKKYQSQIAGIISINGCLGPYYRFINHQTPPFLLWHSKNDQLTTLSDCSQKIQKHSQRVGQECFLYIMDGSHSQFNLSFTGYDPLQKKKVVDFKLFDSINIFLTTIVTIQLRKCISNAINVLLMIFFWIIIILLILDTLF